MPGSGKRGFGGKSGRAVAMVSRWDDSVLRIARKLFLIVLAVVLLPYLLAPLYRGGHPVSTLMAWRWLTGWC